jgi:outer membrane beta-barrel protein
VKTPLAAWVRIGVGLAMTLAFTARAQREDPAPEVAQAIQERAFRMQHEFALGVGALPLDPYSKGLYAQFGYTAHFSDTFAWQIARGAYSSTAKTQLRSQLERDFGILPTAFEEVQFFAGSNLQWKPLYGKLSVVDKWVVHGELHLQLGATLFKFTHAFRPGVNFGLGARVYLNKTFSLRLDVLDNVVIPIGAGPTTLTNVMETTLSIALNLGATE